MPTRTTETFPTRIQLEAIRPDLAAQVPLTVKAGTGMRRAAVCGVITATGYIRERSRSKANGAVAAGGTALVVDDASVFVAGDILKLEDGTTVATVAANGVNVEDNELAVSATAVDVADNDAILASDGSQVAKVISNEAVAATETQDTPISPFVCGILKTDQIIGLDESAVTEMGGVTLPGNKYKF
jgi:hypothetical protein